ncbi:1-(5-phosphoribosyl)-5[(5-phosphoribosylamino)methylideneamino]imidazole-4-carboxamidisomerase [Malassezia japonica]|uniref:1-(5-phosphoribosyl)-5-[(5-phosphoribosylamino)methylideneamino] imidazole-4-carboxamide isomerase n=1 Tax=Malassezia japonica TaxID=223818 RepID=A0AAF0F0A3_9BASI|nr:1-(5-phosphoribosyl)-5[(5-phosphoribosylamino)methylideneamino]imidazole-4-carboxamidisomerase [Malassezia japonica]WFD38087.1 1-(5-phosphoribosyl)-5[(5-phosphoribosylamino)methylideneamino]imidazole-4-carboxamidisomerase [Malassezia japonica]
MTTVPSRSVFRPCIDLHGGEVKQIVGGTLRNAAKGTGDDEAALKTNFVAKHPPSYYADLYRTHQLQGGHVIKLGPGNDAAAEEALKAWPNGLHLGGGITLENAAAWIEKGAEKVIVTSYLFPDCRFALDRLEALEQAVGKERLVVDISCRRRGDEWVVAMNRWQDLTDMVLSKASLDLVSAHCSELLIHAADVEGLCQGIDEELVQRLGEWVSIPTTYAGGARHLEDLQLVDRLSRGRVDLTFGSALDIFGGQGVTLAALCAWNGS